MVGSTAERDFIERPFQPTAHLEKLAFEIFVTLSRLANQREILWLLAEAFEEWILRHVRRTEETVIDAETKHA